MPDPDGYEDPEVEYYEYDEGQDYDPRDDWDVDYDYQPWPEPEPGIAKRIKRLVTGLYWKVYFRLHREDPSDIPF